MAVGLCALDGDGSVDEHLHSFEESFYVLEGSPVLALDGRSYLLRPGACGVVPVGVRHAWVGRAGENARWIDMYAPQPRIDAAGGEDTFFVGPAPTDREPAPLDVRDPRTPEPLPARRGPDGARPPEGRRGRGRADRLREHGHGAAGVQRDRGEDAGRPAARRPAAHDVHGRVRARRRRPPARPPARGGVRDPRGRGRGPRRRRAVHAPGRRRLLDRRRLRSRVLQPHRRARALARDPVSAAARETLLPLQPRLGVPPEPHRE